MQLHFLIQLGLVAARSAAVFGHEACSYPGSDQTADAGKRRFVQGGFVMQGETVAGWTPVAC